MVSRLAVTGSAFCLHLYANGKLLAGAFSSFRKISSCRFRAVVSVPSRSSDFSTMPPSWRALSRALQFDKVPEKEPDWGDDGDDHNQMNGRGRGGNDGTGAGGNGGMGNGGGNFGGDNGNILQKLAALWTAAVTRRPLLTKALSTMIISMAGDYSSQRLVAWRRGDGRFTLDRRRLLSMGIWGFFFIGPALHFWYGALDRSFTGRNAVLLKLLCDQLLFAPVSNASFILGTGTLEGRGLSKSAETLRSTLWPSMKANWTLWPAAQLVNFALVPRQYQILWVNFVAFTWTVVLTYISHNEDKGFLLASTVKASRNNTAVARASQDQIERLSSGSSSPKTIPGLSEGEVERDEDEDVVVFASAHHRGSRGSFAS